MITKYQRAGIVLLVLSLVWEVAEGTHTHPLFAEVLVFAVLAAFFVLGAYLLIHE